MRYGQRGGYTPAEQERRERLRLGAADRFARGGFHVGDRRGLAPLTSLVMPRARTQGAAAVRAFLAAEPEVTAVAGFDDDTAVRILTALRDLGLTVPGDLAVIGFDDGEYGALTTPALTTVHIDAEDHGRQNARAILGLQPADRTAAPAVVIERESV